MDCGKAGSCEGVTLRVGRSGGPEGLRCSTPPCASATIRAMPSFDIVSEVDKQEIDNAINQARKELSQRFDFKGSTATIELNAKESKIEMKAEDASRLKSLSEIVLGKLAKRNIDLRNVERKDPAISPLGHATQDFIIKQGLDGDKAKEIVKAIKAEDFKVQSAREERKIR